MSISKTVLFLEIEHVINSLEMLSVSGRRKQVLQPLIDYIQVNIFNKKDILLNFICTHNSRRSHLAQIWAQVMAIHFNIADVFCYSGGTEATALFPQVIKTLEHIGFKIEIISEGNNPKYSIQYSEKEPSIKGFSKIYDNNFNPKSEFAAVMTCSQADADCPFITGAVKRISIPYEDPKVFDNTTLQAEKYMERSLQIAAEMYYVFSKIK